MALKAQVEKLDDVPEQYRELYSERNGKFEFTGVEGLRTQADIDRLSTSLERERNDHKATKQKYSAFANLDPTEVQSKLDRFEELETLAAGKLDDNKIEEIVNVRIRSKLAPVERERDNLRVQVTEAMEKINGFESANKQRRIHDKIREAASGLNVLPQALEDALLLGERVFELAEDGRVVTRDNVGVTPGLEPSVWLTEMQGKRPHWWAPSAGGGAMGSNSGGTGVNPWTNENWNMTEQSRIYKENKGKAEQLAKSAGTSIGGPRPAPRK